MQEEWSREKTLKFIKLLSSERILWDWSQKQNRVKRKVYEAWKRISINMDNTQIVELKSRKKNLMTRYRSLVRKRAAASEEGYDDEVCQPVWYAFELMDSFLGSLVSTRHDDPLEIEFEIEEKDKMETDIDDEKVKKEIVLDEKKRRLDMKRRNENSDNDSDKTNETNKSFKVDISHCGSYQNLESSNHIYDDDDDDDECELYTRLLAKKLRRYPTATRHRLMYIIDGILLDNPCTKDKILK